jgi:hypothetical protein
MIKRFGPFTLSFDRESWGTEIAFSVSIGKTIYRAILDSERVPSPLLSECPDCGAGVNEDCYWDCIGDEVNK